MSTPTTLRDALSEIHRLRTQVDELLRDMDGRPIEPLIPSESSIDYRESVRILRELINGTDPAKGEEFFPSLVKHLAAALRTKYAVVWTFADEPRTRMRSLAIWPDQGIGENFDGPISGSPCEQTILRRQFYAVPAGVRFQFPDVALLTLMGIESYFAAPLFDSNGAVMGSLVVMHDEPRRLTPEEQTILELFAARAGAELGRQLAEQRLKRSETHFRALIEQALDIVTVLDPDGIIRYQSPSLERIMGWRPDERIGRHAFEFVHPDDHALGLATIQTVLEHPGEIRVGEFRFRHKNGSWRTLEAVGRATTDQDGQACLIVNMRDVTERKRLEQERQQALRDLQNITETVPDILFTLDTQGCLVQWNRRLVTATGYAAHELSNKPALAFVPPEEAEQTTLAIQRAFMDGYAELDGHLLTKDGRQIPYHWTGATLKNSEGTIIGISGVGRDVSERKRVERERDVQHARLVNAQALAQVGSWEWDIESGLMEWSDEQYRIFGHDPQSLNPTHEVFLAALLPDDHDRVLAGLNGALTGPGGCEMEFRIVKPNGEVRTVHCRAEVDRDAGGHPIRMSGSTLDVTERKRTESALQQSETHFRALIEQSSDIITVLALDGTIRFESPSFERLLGYLPQELDGQIAFDYVHEEDLPSVLEKFQLVVQRPGESQRAEFRFRHKDGSWLTLEGVGRAAHDQEGRLCVIVNSREITERKRAEAALARNHELLKSFVTHMPAAIAMLDRDLRYVAVSHRWLQDYRLEDQDLTGKHHYDLFPEIRHMPEWQATHQRCLAGAVERGDNDHFIRADGSEDWTRWEVRPWHDASGAIGGIIMFTEVITERKRAEQALRDSEARTRAILDSALDAIISIDDQGRIIGWNPQAETIFGHLAQDVLGRLLDDTIIPARYRAAHSHGTKRVLQNGPDAAVRRRFEFFSLHRDGHEFPVEFAIASMQIDGRTAFTAFIRDITERKRAEDALRESEERYRTLVELLPSGVFVFCEGRTVYLNQTGVKLLGGNDADEILNRPAFDFMHPSYHDEVRGNVEQMLAGHRSVHRAERLYVKLDGTTFPVQVEAARMAWNGKPAILGIFSDITERKRTEDALQRSEWQLRTVLDTLPVGVWFTDSCGRILLANPAARAIWTGVTSIGLGQSPNQPGWWEQVGPTAEPHRWLLTRALTKGEASLNDTLEIECKDGSRKTIRNSVVPVRNGEGEILGAIILNEDITDQVRAEDALRQNHALLSTIMDAAIDIIFVKDREGRYLLMNAAGAKTLQMPREEITGWTDYALWPAELAASCRTADQRVLTTGETVTVEETSNLDSQQTVFLTTKVPYRNGDGEIIGIIGVSRDITEQKQAESQRERQYQELQAISRMTLALARASTLDAVYAEALNGVERALKTDRAAILLFDQEGIMRFQASRGLSDTYRAAVNGHSPWSRDLQDPPPLLVNDTVTDAMVETDRDQFLAEGIRAVAFVPLVSPSGLLGQFMLYFNHPHQFTEEEIGLAQTIAGHVAYVIQRVEAEEALRISEERFARAFRSSPYPIVISELESGLFLDVNAAACQAFGYRCEDVTVQSSLDLQLWPTPDHRARFVDRLVKNGTVRNVEIDLRKKTGELRHCLVSAELIELHGKRCMVTVGMDITDQMRAERELRRSHDFIRQIIDTDPNFIFAKDREGRFTLVNKAVADGYGTSVDALVGKTDADFSANPEEVASYLEKDREVLDTCHERFIAEETFTDSTGAMRWLQTVKRPILDEQGQATMVLGVSTDITERKRIEEILRQRERDLRAAIDERERISQDLHDGILQSLYAVGLGLESCKPFVTQRHCKKALAVMEQAIGQLNNVMTEVRNFIAGLEADVIQGGNFRTALQTMVQTLTAAQPLRCSVDLEEQAVRSISTEQALHLLNVVREALSNSLRHGQSSTARVSLKRLRRSVRLTIADNGRGFTPAAVHGIGHGLANMEARANKVGGRFSIRSVKHRGTRVIIDLPQEDLHARRKAENRPIAPRR
ncbi:MAG: PAS domain S-box protein [Nitrospira sp.]